MTLQARAIGFVGIKQENTELKEARAKRGRLMSTYHAERFKLMTHPEDRTIIKTFSSERKVCTQTRSSRTNLLGTQRPTYWL